MRLLILDTNSESQLATSKKILNLPVEELDRLNIRIKLAGIDQHTAALVRDSDAVILGPDLGIQATSIARSLLENCPDREIICFTRETVYSSQFIKSAQMVGIHKVLPPFASSVEILQELLAVESAQRKDGKVPVGKLVVFASPKGGAGTTSLVAALGEVCSVAKRKTLLWDMDTESRDLCRALNIPYAAGDMINSWVTNPELLTRECFEKGLAAADDVVSVLPAPTNTAEAMDFLCHSDGKAIVARIVELARYSHDSILVDVGTNMGPAVAALFHLADEIVLLTGECPLSITATEYYVEKIKSITGDTSSIKIQVSGSRIPAESIRAELGKTLALKPRALSLPELPNSDTAYIWPGSGKTLYSLGNAEMKAVLRVIATDLELVDPPKLLAPPPVPATGTAMVEKLRRLKESPRRLFAA